MQQDNNSEYKQGLIYIVTSFLLWGILPIYWKSFVGVVPYEILCERIVWACVSMLAWIGLSGRWPAFYQESRQIFKDRKQTLLLLAASVSISLNWCMFIVAVNSGKITQSSLGYYINPLVSILFGIYYFKEKLTPWTKVAFIFAMIGVLTMIIRVGEIPWVSFGLALTFAIYGLLKKMVKITVITGLTLETIIVLPVALLYINHLHSQGISSWQLGNNQVIVLVVLSGMITAVPLLLFSAGARMVPLNVAGFMQYISPTISLGIGVFLYGEVFTLDHLLSFGFIWLGLLLFTLSQTKWFNSTMERILLTKQSASED